MVLLKIYRTLQITDSTGREKPNFIVMLLNPLIHLLKKLQKVVKTIIDLENIQSILLRDENLISSKIQSSPPEICTDSSTSGNASSNVSLKIEWEIFSIQDEGLLEILEELQKPIKGTIGENDMLEGYFCSDTAFNLSNSVFSDSEIKLFEKGQDFASVQ